MMLPRRRIHLFLRACFRSTTFLLREDLWRRRVCESQPFFFFFFKTHDRAGAASLLQCLAFQFARTKSSVPGARRPADGLGVMHRRLAVRHELLPFQRVKIVRLTGKLGNWAGVICAQRMWVWCLEETQVAHDRNCQGPCEFRDATWCRRA
jgi:hypothetical protein